MVINGLKWLVHFLETRFPEKVDLATLATKDDMRRIEDLISAKDAALVKVQDEAKKQQEQIEKLSLYIGLSRPMQTVLREKMK